MWRTGKSVSTRDYCTDEGGAHTCVRVRIAQAGTCRRLAARSTLEAAAVVLWGYDGRLPVLVANLPPARVSGLIHCVRARKMTRERSERR
jgi:hypothetical protein